MTGLGMGDLERAGFQVEQFAGDAQPLPRAAGKRQCANEECGKALSQYNQGPECHVCTSKATAKRLREAARPLLPASAVSAETARLDKPSRRPEVPPGEVDTERLAKELGFVLRHHRAQADLGMNELARRAGVDRSTLRTLEDGCGRPPIDTLSRLARALRLAPGALLDEAVRRMEESREGDAG